MFPDAGHNHSGTLLHGFFRKDTGHVLGIDFIQVADRFVHEQEIEWLTERTNQRYALLLTERHLSYLYIHLIANAQLKEHILDFCLLLETGQGILEHYIFHGGKLRKEAHVLEKHAERVLADIHPLLHTEISDIVSIESDDALIVVPIAIDVTTKL